MTVAAHTPFHICAVLVGGAALASIGLPVAAQTVTDTTFDFSGDYAPGNWQVRSRNSNGGFRFDGMDSSGTTADSLTLRGSDLGGVSGCLTAIPPDYCAPGFTALFIQIQVPERSLISFNWDYTTYDLFGDPAFDPFGYVLPRFNDQGQVVEGRFVAITDPDGSRRQSGQFSIEVEANQFFAFQIGTLDNQFGPAEATIDRFSVTAFMTPPEPATVPEPGSAIAFASLTLLALRLTAGDKRSARR